MTVRDEILPTDRYGSNRTAARVASVPRAGFLGVSLRFEAGSGWSERWWGLTCARRLWSLICGVLSARASRRRDARAQVKHSPTRGRGSAGGGRSSVPGSAPFLAGAEWFGRSAVVLLDMLGEVRSFRARALVASMSRPRPVSGSFHIYY